jgi:hypothetical protein
MNNKLDVLSLAEVIDSIFSGKELGRRVQRSSCGEEAEDACAQNSEECKNCAKPNEDDSNWLEDKPEREIVKNHDSGCLSVSVSGPGTKKLLGMLQDMLSGIKANHYASGRLGILTTFDIGLKTNFSTYEHISG